MAQPHHPRPTADQPTIPTSLGDGETATLRTLADGRHPSPTPPTPKRQVAAVPEVIAGYRRMRQLGAGGMGEVHLAHHERLGRQVALKLMRPNVADDPEFAQRFLRESKAMAAVSHPNVVAIHDAGETDGFLFMAIEFVEGTDLHRLLKTRGTIDEAAACRIAIGCCRGLEAIHAAGLVHRDIKPANLFLDRTGEPKIGDLGLARHTDGGDRMTMTGSAWGTPAYMSPEQLRGVADIDIRADLYALGATLFIALTGSEPFTGETSFVVTNKILSEPAPDPRTFNRTVSPALAAIIRTCLEKSRAKRYPDPATMRADLERARDGLPLAFAQVLDAAPKAAPIVGAERRTPAPRVAHGGGWITGINPLYVKIGAYSAAVGLLAAALWSLQGETRVEHRPPTIGGDVPKPAAAPTEAPPERWMAQHGRDAIGEWAVIRVGDEGMRVRHLPPATFRMGSPADEPGRSPAETAHQVTLDNGFWIADTEVTNGLWRAVRGEAPGGEAHRPVEHVSWIDAHDFLSALAAKIEGAEPRLPTEAEWEYACRGGSAEAFAGGAQPEAKEWIERPGKGAREVAQGPANRFGLFDLAGNLREWCVDSWDGASDYGGAAQIDPEGRFGKLAVLRGGSWSLPARAARSAARSAADPQERPEDAGFRFVIPAR